MNFVAALAAPTIERRNELIKDELYNESWEEHVEDHLENGGWPEDCQVTDIDTKMARLHQVQVYSD